MHTQTQTEVIEAQFREFYHSLLQIARAIAVIILVSFIQLLLT